MKINTLKTLLINGTIVNEGESRKGSVLIEGDIISAVVYEEDFKEWFEDEVVKTSYNIIDLVKCGDYVNGLRVEESKYGELYTSYTYMGGDIGLQQETYTTFLKDYEEDDVYSILTREQFESMSYKVDE